MVPAITCIASVWIPINKNAEISNWITKPLKIGQKAAAQVIIGLFKTVLIYIAEAEAGISLLDIQVRRRIIKHWISCYILPHSHLFLAIQKGSNKPEWEISEPWPEICPINVSWFTNALFDVSHIRDSLLLSTQ